MSFSTDTKEELEQVIGKARHCLLAEMDAIALNCGSLKRDNDRKTFVFESENECVLKKCFTILQKTFNIVPVRVNNKSSHSLVIDKEEDADLLLKALKLESADWDRIGEYTADSRLTAMSCCKRAFIRGAFLAAGSVSTPEKGYHFEIVSVSESRALQLQQMMHSFDIDAKIVVRKKYYVVYVKEGNQIADMLSVMEAPVALMNFENVRILKDVRNTVNRRVNCEAANISKTASAAYSQLEEINYISRYYGLGNLPEGLEQVARLRLEKPEASLTELGRLLDPPVSKSGVNHRLKKLKLIAEQIREKKEEDYDSKKYDNSDSGRT